MDPKRKWLLVCQSHFEKLSQIFLGTYAAVSPNLPLPSKPSIADLGEKQLKNIARPVTALRFFCAVTLGRSEVTERMPFVREPRKLPAYKAMGRG